MILPTWTTDVTGKPNDNIFYALVLVAIVSFGFGIFSMIRKKLAASIITIVGLLLLAAVTFVIPFFSASIGY